MIYSVQNLLLFNYRDKFIIVANFFITSNIAHRFTVSIFAPEMKLKFKEWCKVCQRLLLFFNTLAIKVLPMMGNPYDMGHIM